MSEKSRQRFLLFKEQIRQESLDSLDEKQEKPPDHGSKTPILQAQKEKTLSLKRMSTVKKLQENMGIEFASYSEMEREIQESEQKVSNLINIDQKSEYYEIQATEKEKMA